MSNGLYSGISAMRASERRMDAITANLANLSTTAYKRRDAVTRAFSVGRGRGQPLAARTTYRTDFAQGELERTGNPYDLALMGDGHFAVEGPSGEMYTRNGSFRTDDEGNLLTAEGYPVAWEGGRGQVDPVGPPVTIGADGTVVQDGAELGKLRIVSFPAVDRLEIDGDGYYHADPALRRLPSDAEVHQSALERSNVSSVDELVRLITVQRSFESASSLMRMIDQSYRRLNGSR